jgi:hypothetical protein
VGGTFKFCVVYDLRANGSSRLITLEYGGTVSGTGAEWTAMGSVYIYILLYIAASGRRSFALLPDKYLQNMYVWAHIYIYLYSYS